MSSRSVLFGIGCAAAIAVAVVGCDTPFDSSTWGSDEGNSCDMSKPNTCSKGLDCYVPPNCASAFCCPPQDPTALYSCSCAAPDNSNAGDDGGTDASSTADGPSTD